MSRPSGRWARCGSALRSAALLSLPRGGRSPGALTDEDAGLDFQARDLVALALEGITRVLRSFFEQVAANGHQRDAFGGPLPDVKAVAFA